MNKRATNLYMISSEDEFNRFVMSGGWVVVVCDTPSPIIINHPSSLGASILLPPYEAVAEELDDNYELADTIYYSHLASDACDTYINAILAAVLTSIPIALYFGPEEIGMRFVKVLINYLYQAYGIVVGIEGRVVPYIEEPYLPIILSRLYINNVIDYEVFMINHPLLPIDKAVISKMIVEVNPWVPDTSFDGYYKYFMDTLAAIKNNGNRMLINPLIGDVR